MLNTQQPTVFHTYGITRSPPDALPNFGDIDDPVIIARRKHAARFVELRIGLRDARLVGDGDHSHPAAENAQRVDAIERLRSCRDLHHGKPASLRPATPLIGARQMVAPRLHDAGDLAMPLAPTRQRSTPATSLPTPAALRCRPIPTIIQNAKPSS